MQKLFACGKTIYCENQWQIIVSIVLPLLFILLLILKKQLEYKKAHKLVLRDLNEIIFFFEFTDVHS